MEEKHQTQDEKQPGERVHCPPLGFRPRPSYMERGCHKDSRSPPLGPFKLGKLEFLLTHRDSGLQAAAGA